jgi:site-specific DNA-methyltransferase (adenine-specific)
MIGTLDIRLCDCMDLMREFPDKHFDLAIVDPPYGIGNFIPQQGMRAGGNFPAVTWNDETPDDCYFKELERVSIHRVIWGANYYNCFSKNGGAVVWDKNQHNPKLSRCEIASNSKEKRVSYINITCNGIHGDDSQRVHPCQKPVALYRWLLANYATPGMRVLDTHLGSGSIAIACHYFGAHLTASEIDPDYYAAAVARIERDTSQSDMFTASNDPHILNQPELIEAK